MTEVLDRNLLTPQEHRLTGGDIPHDLDSNYERDFYKPWVCRGGKTSIKEANRLRQEIKVDTLGLVEGMIDAENVVFSLEELDSTGKTLHDPKIGFKDEKGRFVPDVELTGKLYGKFKDFNIDLHLRESLTGIESKASGVAENKA